MNEGIIETALREAFEAKTQLVEDWQFLVGCEVDVCMGRQLLRTGVIDAATVDGGIVWISRQGVQERRLLTRADGYDLWITKLDNQRVLARRDDG
ncbi:hypothetical protein [Pseudarthrobacter sp. IC2-21]|uniref:hypothetical protein n=1 Tax=Pseudarthrobacter sp. IC2-21 TaxID=3092262 RepID=UPI002A69D90B|nr:hypothetical protein [Pseudarthrobacter sp. IC2-21]